jgi:hypothetical protein
MTNFEAVTIGIAVISIVIATLTLVQNSKMIESSKRPYISVYIDTVNVASPYCYVIMKNTGVSSALITDINYPLELLKFGYGSRDPFANLIGATLAPSQKVFLIIEPKKLHDLYNELPRIDFKISYSYGSKNYTEINNLKFDIFSGELSLRASRPNNEMQTISYSLQELIERIL